MVPIGRPGLTAAQKGELWERWKRGESLSDIGRMLGKQAASVFGVLRTSGGISPPPRCRRPQSLTLRERTEISRRISANESIRAIASALGRSPSTVSREVARNGGRERYCAETAEAAGQERARRPKPCKLALNGQLRRIVARKLGQKWSPEQIAGWLRRTYPDDESLQVSHETIYRTLYIQARGALKKELLQHLRSRRLMRHSRYATTKGQPRGQIIDAVSISERPPEVEDRAVPGHWEGDLICGTQNTHVATLVERHSRYTILVKLHGKDTTTVVSALIRQMRNLPEELRQSLTWDRGPEMAQHKRFTVATDLQVYFCDPQSPWQRGSNENTNRLLRQYLPKGTDLSVHSQADLNKIARQLNTRPRKTLGFITPADKLQESVAMTS